MTEWTDCNLKKRCPNFDRHIEYVSNCKNIAPGCFKGKSEAPRPQDSLGSGELTGYVPAEVLDLVRFMAKTWAEVDKFVYANCTSDALMQYPVIQGTRNQIDLAKIGEQPINKENLSKAVQWMLST